MPVSMLLRPQSPEAIAELQGVEFARVLSLVEHFQKCAGQHVLVWESNLGTPTPTSAATSASCKKASGTASRSSSNSCSTQVAGSKSRRYRSDSGVSHARLASISTPGRAHATSADPGNVSAQRSITSLQSKVFHHMGGTRQKSCKEGSYDSSSGSGNNIIKLAVDCTAIVDVPTGTSGCIPAVYGCGKQGLDGSPELGIDSVNRWTLSSASSSSSDGDSPQMSDDPLTAALWDRVQQLQQSNRLLEQQVQQMQAEMNQQQEQQKQQHDEQSQSGVLCHFQDMQLQVCLLPVVSIVADSPSVGAISEAAAPAGAQCSNGSSSSSCYVIAAPPRPVAVSWLAEDEEQQQQQQGHKHVGITINTVPALNLSNQQQQQQQEEEEVTADPAKSPPPPAHYSIKPSYHGSKSCPGFPAATTDQQQLLLEDEEQYVSLIMSLQRELGRLQMLQQLQQTDYEDLELVLKETEKQRREYAARYAFVVLDHDNDGYISTDQVERYELFASYAPEVLARAFQQWRWRSGFPGYLNMEDFVRFVEYADDRSSRTSQRFWFSVLDSDGDGHLGWQDMRQAYEAVDKSSAAYIIGFDDLMNQIRDMVEFQQHPELGFSCSELCGSRLGAGVIALLTNHNNMLLQRSTAEWGRGDFPL